MTRNAAAGILRRRREYLIHHLTGKYQANLPYGRETREIEALTVALQALEG